MAEFVSTFITGFQSVVAKDLPQRLNGIKIINIFDGLVHYKYTGNSRDLEKIIYFNNTFFILKAMDSKKSDAKNAGLKSVDFNYLVNTVAQEKKYYLINKGSFRVRFIKENQFEKVDKKITAKAEETVLKNSKLKLDRLSPSTEIWYCLRSEGFAFCGQLISKREFTEKNLNKGELRPELAYLISAFSEISPHDTILEPFCGYGSIPVQLSKRFNFAKLLVSDIDSEKIEALREKKALQKEAVKVSVQDALVLPQIDDNSIDMIISDPPWGFYEDIGDICDFYRNMFNSFRRVLKSQGKMIILTARTEELKKITTEQNIIIEDSLHTLVNGKKASLYKLKF